jgi:hypothetical protein
MTNTSAISELLELELEELMGRLQTLAGEIRRHIHLTGRECGLAWDELEPGLFELERHVGLASEASIDDLRQLGRELQGRLKRLRESMSH